MGGVDDAAECRRAVDADIFELVPVAVVRRLKVSRYSIIRAMNRLLKLADNDTLQRMQTSLIDRQIPCKKLLLELLDLGRKSALRKVEKM